MSSEIKYPVTGERVQLAAKTNSLSSAKGAKGGATWPGCSLPPASTVNQVGGN